MTISKSQELLNNGKIRSACLREAASAKAGEIRKRLRDCEFRDFGIKLLNS
jgi:hypothetical protein